jgi:hypothetical protein
MKGLKGLGGSSYSCGTTSLATSSRCSRS